MVYQSVQSLIKKWAVPFTVVTTANLFLAFQTSAASVTAMPVESTGLKGMYENITSVSTHILNGIKWIANFHENSQEISLNFLSTIYKLLSSIVLTTPTIIFNNPHIKSIALSFSVVSISLVTLLTIYEALMQITKKRHTKFKDIAKRYAFAVTASGFAPFIFEKLFQFLNKITKAITQIGGDFSNSKALFENQHISVLDTYILMGFDVVLFVMLFPILLQNGRRWWDLMSLVALTPLAFTASVFDRHKHFYDSWLRSLKQLSLVQLVYAVYILLLGIFIFSTSEIAFGSMLLIKMLIVAGGMWRLLNPPNFVLAYTRIDNKDVFSVYDSYKSSFRQVVDTLTMKHFRPANFFRNHSTNKKKETLELRKKHGVRHIKGLKK